MERLEGERAKAKSEGERRARRKRDTRIESASTRLLRVVEALKVVVANSQALNIIVGLGDALLDVVVKVVASAETATQTKARRHCSALESQKSESTNTTISSGGFSF